MDAAVLTAIAAWLTLVVYVIIGFFAKRQLDEYRDERRRLTRPYVVVDFTTTTRIDLVISNVGSTCARDIRTKFSEPLTSTIIPETGAVVAIAFREGEGLAMIPPGKSYHFVWDVAPERLRSNLCMRYTVTVDYKDDHGESFKDCYVLDLMSIANAAAPVDHIAKIASAIGSIQQEVGKWADQSEGLLVHSRDKDRMILDENDRYRRLLAKQRSARSALDPNPLPAVSPALRATIKRVCAACRRRARSDASTRWRR